MRVLYATDGSSVSRYGERLITSLFDPARCEIETFSVTPELSYAGSPDMNWELIRLDVPIVNGERIADEAADHLGDAGFEAIPSSSRGNPAREILDVLQRREHQLVVLGASHSTWMGTWLLGSVSTQVLHHAPCSVLVTHRPPKASGRVLFATDDSAEAGAALNAALGVLDPTKTSFTVATVVSLPWVSVAVYPPGPPFGDYAPYHDEEKRRIDHAWQSVERTQRDVRLAGFECDGVVLEGHAGPQLLKETENLRADLVVIGSRGSGALHRAFLGSVSDPIARHAPAALVGRDLAPASETAKSA